MIKSIEIFRVLAIVIFIFIFLIAAASTSFLLLLATLLISGLIVTAPIGVILDNPHLLAVKLVEIFENLSLVILEFKHFLHPPVASLISLSLRLLVLLGITIALFHRWLVPSLLIGVGVH